MVRVKPDEHGFENYEILKVDLIKSEGKEWKALNISHHLVHIKRIWLVLVQIRINAYGLNAYWQICTWSMKFGGRNGYKHQLYFIIYYLLLQQSIKYIIFTQVISY